MENKNNPFDVFDVKTRIENLPSSFQSFDAMFQEAELAGSVERSSNQFERENIKSLFNSSFNTWLRANKKWDGKNKKAYLEKLTPANWVEFLNWMKTEDKALKDAIEKRHKKMRIPEETTSDLPRVAEASVEDVLEILQDFCPKESHQDLKLLLKGEAKPKKKIHWQGFDWQLPDAFGKLHKKQIWMKNGPKTAAWIQEHWIRKDKKAWNVGSLQTSFRGQGLKPNQIIFIDDDLKITKTKPKRKPQ